MTALFVQMGASLPKGGPAGLFLGFVVYGTIVLAVNQCFGIDLAYTPYRENTNISDIQRRWSPTSRLLRRLSGFLVSGLMTLWASPWDGTISSSWVGIQSGSYGPLLILYSIQHPLRNYRHPRPPHLLDRQDPCRRSSRSVFGTLRVRPLHRAR